MKESLPKKNSRGRMPGHDYKAPCMYMITTTARSGMPLFSNIGYSDRERKHVALMTEFGRKIYDNLRIFTQLSPDMEVYNSVVMPDHVHFILHVKKRLPKHVGIFIGRFKVICSKMLDRRDTTGKLEPLFEDDYHDRILFTAEQRRVVKAYIGDNPRRLWIKRQHPDLFKKYLHLRIGDIEFAAYGNIFLLRDFQKLPVIVHRIWSKPEYKAVRDQHYKQWMECAENGGVLVSPFISKDEKTVRDAAIEKGGNIIRIQADGLPERFKPWGREFELCAMGRLLLVAPWPDKYDTNKILREECLGMNELARMICSHDLDLGLLGI